MFSVHCMKTSKEQPIIKQFTMKIMIMDCTKLN
jgi:hypothetical protein